jgi:hypothetical protein
VLGEQDISQGAQLLGRAVGVNVFDRYQRAVALGPSRSVLERTWD